MATILFLGLLGRNKFLYSALARVFSLIFLPNAWRAKVTFLRFANSDLDVNYLLRRLTQEVHLGVVPPPERPGSDHESTGIDRPDPDGQRILRGPSAGSVNDSPDQARGQRQCWD